MSKPFLTENEIRSIFKSNLKIETYSKSIDNLYSKRQLNKINFKPYYQRNYVWDEHKASYFIESILLGTEIPPLILFNNDENIEVIDGRQRFETIKRFNENDIHLTKKGLFQLKKFAKKNFSTLCEEYSELSDIFSDAKIRIIEFEVVNSSDFNENLEDRIKKEIFARYNSGITPLKNTEIENAIYVEDKITNTFKEALKKNERLRDDILNLFLKAKNTENSTSPEILRFIRRSLILSMIPIKFIARGSYGKELCTKFYEHYSDGVTDSQEVYGTFCLKLNVIKRFSDIVKQKGIKPTRFVYECFLWALHVLESENLIDVENVDDDILNEFADHVFENELDYTDINYHYFEETMTRYSSTICFFESKFSRDLQIYIAGSNEKSEEIKELKKVPGPQTPLNQLESLRVTKPEPTRNSIDDVLRRIQKSRFLVRPPYQRNEVMNYPKASSLIESILLGIMLPAIFIFKRLDGVSEVIDGQQRLLTILGFLGEKYLNEENKLVPSKKHNFKLKDLKILKEFKGKGYEDLSTKLKEKILDFELFIVEIEQRLNKEFDPVDLFIRLNDKPYPIPENSFEMWNSWVERDVIEKIKNEVKKVSTWFYMKPSSQLIKRNRMENEELFTCITYLFYKQYKDDSVFSYLDIYQKSNRINARIKEKRDITNVFALIADNEQEMVMFHNAINDTTLFVKKLKFLLDCNDEITLDEKLNNLFSFRKKKYVRRTLQDFYILWYLLNSAKDNEINKNRNSMFREIKKIFTYMKNIPEEDSLNNQGYDRFQNMCEDFVDICINKKN